jgi:predicted dehydrogenase
MTTMAKSPARGQEVRWGVIGPGRIADTVLGDFPLVEGAQVVAVASRSAARAEDFARQHGIERAYGSYAALLGDADVDVVYIATPHAQHHAVALAALGAGKALLVEKTFTATVAGAREIVDLARRTGSFAMEAMWMKFQPAIARLRQLVAEGAIGEVRAVQAAAGLVLPYDPAGRHFDLSLGGGVLLDAGVYPVTFAHMLLGTPDRVTATGSLFPTGVDAEAGLLLGYEDGRSAALTVSMRCPIPAYARVFGTSGWIDVVPPFLRPGAFVLHRKGTEPETVEAPVQGHGYAAELAEVTRCVREGHPESLIVPLSDTLAVLEVLEEAAAQLGARFTEDPHALAT